MLLGLLLFALMAMAALVIDLGFARLTQRQMQTAVDSAAVEGLRYRDRLPADATTTDLDTARRDATSQVVAWTFDDDLDAANGDDGIAGNGGAFGAGPLVEFSGGAGDLSLNASQLLAVPETPVFKPQTTSGPGLAPEPGLSVNLANVTGGDMVAGSFDRNNQNPDFNPPGGDLNRSIHEYVDVDTGEYVRRNFTIPVDDPSTPDNEAVRDAFLVRMRRSSEAFSPDVGIPTSPLPYLFARGSLIARSTIASGITVRATSVASLEPVISVGNSSAGMVGNSSAGIMGGIGLAVSINDWNDTDSDTFFAFDANVIGEVIDPVDAEPNPGDQDVGYVAIFDEMSNGASTVNRVIGFGIASISGGELIKSPLVDGVQIASENASALPCFALPVSGIDLELVFDSRRDNRDSLALAPVSAR